MSNCQLNKMGNCVGVTIKDYCIYCLKDIENLKIASFRLYKQDGKCLFKHEEITIFNDVKTKEYRQSYKREYTWCLLGKKTVKDNHHICAECVNVQSKLGNIVPCMNDIIPRDLYFCNSIDCRKPLTELENWNERAMIFHGLCIYQNIRENMNAYEPFSADKFYTMSTTQSTACENGLWICQSHILRVEYLLSVIEFPADLCTLLLSYINPKMVSTDCHICTRQISPVVTQIGFITNDSTNTILYTGDVPIDTNVCICGECIKIYK